MARRPNGSEPARRAHRRHVVVGPALGALTAIAATLGHVASATASPPAGWTPDFGGWSQPLEGAHAALRGARDAESIRGDVDPRQELLRRAETWLALVPRHAMTARLRHALALELAVLRGDTDAVGRSARLQLDGCLPIEDAPWAGHAAAQIATGVASATVAWSILSREPFVPGLADAWLGRATPVAVQTALRRRLLIEAPDHPAARATADELGIAGIAAMLPEIEARVRRVEALLEAHDNDRARLEALAWLEAASPSPPFACRLAYVAGKAARKARRYSDALRQLEASRARCEAAGDDVMWLRSILLEAQVHRILSQPAEIGRLYAAATRRAPGHSFLDDLLFLRADALEGVDRTREAAAVHRRLVERYPGGDMAPTSAWRLARAALDRHPEAARAWLQRAAELAGPGTTDAARARYWRARLDEAVRPDAARAAYASLFRRMGYYGLLARMRLHRLAPAVARELETELRAAASARSSRAPLSSSGLRSAARTARRLRDDEWASAMLEELACNAEAGRRFEIAEVLVDLDDHAAAQRVLRPAAPAVLTEVGQPSVEAWRTAYSRPHFGSVLAAARAADLDPWLLLGLAREESTFDAQIISWAGAIGLTQLMPPTAIGAHAAVFRRPLTDLEALTDPALNLRLGAHVLREGFDRWGQAPLAISAYNAGNGLTSRFLRDAPQPLDQFVEGISVRQTRGYVKRVLESWARYRLLYGEDPFVQLPARVIRR